MKKIFLAIAALAMIAMGANAQTTGKVERTGGIKVKVVQLWENGPAFAEYNVGAENNLPEDMGGYYAWGGSQDKVDDHNTGTENLAGDNDAATKLWGENWRMPTQNELYLLTYYCNAEWTTVNGVNGRKYTGKGEFSTNSIFLPAAGMCNYGTVINTDIRGSYWSSTMYNNLEGSYLAFSSTSENGGEFTVRRFGFSVRAVCEIPVVPNAMSLVTKTESATDTLNIRLASTPRFVVSEDGLSITAYKGNTQVSTYEVANVANLFYTYIDHMHTLTKIDSVPATDETTGHKAYWECTGSAEDSACHKYFADSLGTQEIGDSTALAAWLSEEGAGFLPIEYDKTKMYAVVNGGELIVRTDRVSVMKNDVIEDEDTFVMTYTLKGEQTTYTKEAAKMKGVEFKLGNKLND